MLRLEEGFVGADDFGVLVQPLANARTQADQAFDTFGGQKRITENLLGLLPNAIHAARALNEPDDGPRQVVVHNNGGILQVLALAQNVRCDDDAEFLIG